MAQPRIGINKNGTTFPIYDFHTSAQIGTLLINELFVDAGYDMVSNANGRSEAVYWAMTPSGWRMCRLYMVEYQGYDLAYSRDKAHWTINSSRHVFNVRRKCRIFRGSTEITSIYSGDSICTDGNSYGGSTYPYRLSINGYCKGGKWVYEEGLWCDTDIEVGYSTNPTVYGK